MAESSISVYSPESLLAVFGARDQHVRKIRDAFGVRVSTRNGQIHIEGDEEAVIRATEVLEQLRSQAVQGAVTADDVNRLLTGVRQGESPVQTSPLVVHGGRQVRPRSPGQARYVAAIREHHVTFCYGPAGTGKTYLAVATAVTALRSEQMRKIVLVRPAVEAGESLGYLPGDLQAKINPYLRPLTDALREMLDHDTVKRYMEQDVIEVIPLAYMRGRTLNEAFIILDEAQNTTVSQMKMFLTRMGNGSKIVASGDVTQVDLPAHTRSGMVDGLTRLRGISAFAAVELGQADIVRHPMVQEIVRAYEQKPGRRH
jgi:phosphate starvation-inducible PhoH-like protein